MLLQCSFCSANSNGNIQALNEMSAALQVELNAGLTAATAKDIMSTPKKRAAWVSSRQLGAAGTAAMPVPQQMPAAEALQGVCGNS